MEAVFGHDVAEVVVLGTRPTSFPIGPICIALALQQLIAADCTRRSEQDPQVKHIMEFGATAVSTLEHHNAICGAPRALE